LVALIGYFLLVPHFGVYGAILATVAGQTTRLGLYLAFGRRVAPIPYSWGTLAAVVLINAMLIYFVRGATSMSSQIVYLIVAGAALSLLTLHPLLALRKPIVREAFA